MANPKVVTLVADTDTTVTLDSNAGYVEVALIANAATTVFNTRNAAIASATPADGNHTLTSSLPAKIVADETAGAASIVRLRSSGTPTVSVCGI